MNEIVQIIATRDSLDEDEARRIVEDAVTICRDLVREGAGVDEVEDVWAEETGLEPDYLYNVLC